MAKKGLRYAVFATRTETTSGGSTTITYSGGKNISPVVAFNGSMNRSDAKDYGDDVVQDTDNAVTGGTLSVELNNDEDDIYTMLLGHTATEGLIEFKDTDVAPYVGVGAIGKSGAKWVAIWYPKVQFHEPNDDNQTRQESPTFNHVTVEGDILIPEDNVWKKREAFDTLPAAKTWLNTQAGIS